MNTPQGNAVVGLELLQAAAELLGDQAAFDRGISAVFSHLRLSCPLCSALVRRDGELIQIMCEWLESSSATEPVLSGRRLCLPHTCRCLVVFKSRRRRKHCSRRFTGRSGS
jgi:hypothetical protein